MHSASVRDLLQSDSIAARAVMRDHDLFEKAFHLPGTAIARIWTNENCLVVPRAWRTQPAVRRAAEFSKHRGWPVIYRTSGGSCVPHGQGVANLSLIQSDKQENALTSSEAYAQIVSITGAALMQFGLHSCASPVPQSVCDGAWNICVGFKKFGGTAQRRGTRSGVTTTLTHASLFCGDVTANLIYANDFLRDCGAAPCELSVHYSLSNEQGVNIEAFIKELTRALSTCASHNWVLEI